MGYFEPFYSFNGHFSGILAIYHKYNLVTLVRVTRSGHFEQFYSVNWHFQGFFAHFSCIPSGHPAHQINGNSIVNLEIFEKNSLDVELQFASMYLCLPRAALDKAAAALYAYVSPSFFSLFCLNYKWGPYQLQAESIPTALLLFQEFGVRHPRQNGPTLI